MNKRIILGVLSGIIAPIIVLFVLASIQNLDLTKGSIKVLVKLFSLSSLINLGLFLFTIKKNYDFAKGVFGVTLLILVFTLIMKFMY